MESKSLYAIISKKIKYSVLMNIRDIDEKENIIKFLKEDKNIILIKWSQL